MKLASLRLKKNEDKRIRAGHVWVFSNEIALDITPLASLEAGQCVLIEDHRGKPLGTGYVNPRSLISARLISRDPLQGFDRPLLIRRLNTALSLRQHRYRQPYYRLVFGESDGLPGLVVDRYGDILVAQLTTAGMERMKEEVIGVLQHVLKPSGMVLRNDTQARSLEGLSHYVETRGEVPEKVRLTENDTQFEISPLTGQKTGWFYDHRENRADLQRYAQGLRVLDLFSYVGGWGIQMARAGAAAVTCIDSSEPALAQLRDNAQLNGVDRRVHALRGEAFEVLKTLRAEHACFDLVIVDPPAFIKRKKDQATGEQAYGRLNQAAMRVLAKDGLLLSASCSYHMARDKLHRLLIQAGHHTNRRLVLLGEGHQSPDHPILLTVPETAYLKAFLCRLLPD